MDHENDMFFTRCPECLRRGVHVFQPPEIGVCDQCGARVTWCAECDGTGVIDPDAEPAYFEDCPHCQGTGLELIAWPIN